MDLEFLTKKSDDGFSKIIIPFSLTSICNVSSVIMPSVKGSSSSLMVAVDWAGTHLTQPQMSLFSVQTVCEKEKNRRREHGITLMVLYSGATGVCNPNHY